MPQPDRRAVPADHPVLGIEWVSPPQRTAETPEARRCRELSRLPKIRLSEMHVASGGLMGIDTYMTWTHDELLTAVLEDEGFAQNARLPR